MTMNRRVPPWLLPRDDVLLDAERELSGRIGAPVPSIIHWNERRAQPRPCDDALRDLLRARRRVRARDHES
jgi:hypothetical protein